MRVLPWLVAAGVLLLVGCGGSSSSVSNTPPVLDINNHLHLIVNRGISSQHGVTNGIYTTVTVCAPGTSNCQAIPDVLVDTSSEGLRILSSSLCSGAAGPCLGLPAVADSANNQLQECVGFADGSYVWGSIDGADIEIAGEKGLSVPIQVISSPNSSPPVPSSCGAGGPNDGTVDQLGANGILGVGVFRQDCGSACTTSTPPALYYVCPGGVCSVASVLLNSQLQNPVWTFPQDNNGLSITLPSIPDTGAQTADGYMTFGIGTQKDNAPILLAQVYSTDSNGDIKTVYDNATYGGTFFNTSSAANYFLDHATLGIPDCTDYASYYCPGSTEQYTVTNAGFGGGSAPVTITVANGDTLFTANSGQNAAFSNLAGDSGTDPSSDYFDFGMPFFYSRTVYIGIEGQTSPGNFVGPYYAY
jgi:hypothetical protein